MGEQRFVIAVPYVIPVTFAAVAAGVMSNTTPAINVGPYNFVWTRLAIQTANSGGVFSVMIKDVADSKNFMESAVRSNLLVPNDNKMVDIPRPGRFNAFSSIYVEATNNGGSQDSLYIALHGYLEQ